MGLSLTSIHIYSDSVPADCGFNFRSFSENWFTCIDPLPCEEMKNTYSAARKLSKKTSATVLWFYLFDSDMIWMTFFKDGKTAASYTNDGFTPGKKLFSIPALVGYEDGNKKRISNILACPDVLLKIEMLEEFFGVDLLFEPYLLETDQNLSRTRGDTLYKQYIQEEKPQSHRKPLMALKCIVKFPGKLYDHYFEGRWPSEKHYFLLQTKQEDGSAPYVPVRFTGAGFEPCDPNHFENSAPPRFNNDPRFRIAFSADNGRGKVHVEFTDQAPALFQGKAFPLPAGYFPADFLPTGEFLLSGHNRLAVVNSEKAVLANPTFKGELVDILDGHIVTTTGHSFYYGDEPGAMIYIYQLQPND